MTRLLQFTIMFGYPLLWLAIIFWNGAHAWAIPMLFAIALALFVLELVFSSTHLLKRVAESFTVPLLRMNLFLMWTVAVVASIIIVTDLWVLATLIMTIIVFATYIELGIAMGNINTRASFFPDGANFPLDLVRLYESSLNPNIRKAQSMFIYVIIPMGIAAMFLDWRLISIVILLQVDNIYTRLRMTVPIALFLTTKYELSRPEWLRLKHAAGELSIPSLILSKDNEVPSNIGIHQDLVRLQSNLEWKSGVKLVAKYSRYVLIDTHSVSDALKVELKMAREEPFVGKVMFIRRDTMDPFIISEVRELEKIAKRRLFYSVEDLCNILATDRNRFLGGLPRSPIQKRIVYAEVKRKMSSK